MQGLPFFSFSGMNPQGPVSLSDTETQTSPLTAPYSSSIATDSSGPEQATALPEFMQNLIQAMSAESPLSHSNQGQGIAAEEAPNLLEGIIGSETDIESAASMMLPNQMPMDMESIQTQRNLNVKLSDTSSEDLQGLPSLMARTQLTQAQMPQTQMPQQEMASSDPQSPANAAQVSELQQLKMPAQPVGLASVNVMAQSNTEAQAYMPMANQLPLGSSLKAMGVNLDTQTQQPSKGSSPSAKLAELMTPVTETSYSADKTANLEQVATANVASLTDVTSDVGDAIDEMWQQAQSANRQAGNKLASSNSPSFFEQQLQAKLDVPPSDIRFGEQVSKRIGMMVTEQMQSAKIQLDPPELGSLEIKVRVQQDQVSVSFASNNHAVRDALESQAPRLREMLNQQGVELGDLDVSSQGQQNQGGDAQQYEGPEGFVDEDGIAGSDALENIEKQIAAIENDGSVDYFA